MNRKEIKLGDLVRLDGLEKPNDDGLKFIFPDKAAESASKEVSKLAGDLENYNDVKVGEVEDVTKAFGVALEKMKVVYYGDAMSMPEYLAIENKAGNKEIFEEFGAEEFRMHRDLTYLPISMARKLVKYDSGIYLMRFKKISLELAKILAEHKNALLDLRHVKEMSKEIAMVLAGHKGDLNLGGLEQIDEEIAAELAKSPGSLSLRGLREIPAEVAEKLGERKGELWLGPYLSEYEVDYNAAAMGLGKHQGALHLNGKWKMDLEAATELGKHHGDLHLFGVEGLDGEKAKELAKNEGSLFLDSFPQAALTEEVAKELAQCKGNLTITGSFENIDLEVLRELCECQQGLALPAFEDNLTEKMAEILAGHVGALQLAVRGGISDEAMEALLKHQGEINGNDNFLYLRKDYLKRKGLWYPK